MLSYCGAGEDSWESLGLQGDQTSSSKRKSTLNTHAKDWCWSWSSNILATWGKELSHCQRPWWKSEGKRRRLCHRMRWSDNIVDSMDINVSKFWEPVDDRRAWHAVVHGVTNSHAQLRDRTTKVPASHSIPPPDPLMQLCLDMRLERQVGWQKFTVPGAFWLPN